MLAPKTIDNDLGLNYRHEPDEWVREPIETPPGYRYARAPSRTRFDLDQMVNYVTPGYATAVFVSAQGVQRIRTTAESHRRIAIIEVMGRHSGYLALGAAYGQPDIVLMPESPLNIDRLVERVVEIYDLQKNVVIVCAEGIVDEEGRELGAEVASTDPAGNKVLSGAAEALRQILIGRLGDDYFTSKRRNESAKAAIFTRKVGHTQRGGRPILFDRFYGAQLGGQAVDLLLEGHVNGVAILQWNRERGFHVARRRRQRLPRPLGPSSTPARCIPSFYDRGEPAAVADRHGVPAADLPQRHRPGRHGGRPPDLFNPGNLTQPYHSVNVDINKRICYLD